MDVELKLGVLVARARLTLRWLLRSIEVHGRRGSSAFYSPWRHPWKRWAPAYPETTGYLLPTLIRAEQHFEDVKLRPLIESCGRWLLGMALDDGSFPELYGHTKKSSFFNTGQILLGLVAMWRYTEEKPYQLAMQRALEWMLAEHWESPQPAYYSRAWWGALVAARSLSDGQAELKIMDALDELSKHFRANGALDAWGFEGKSRAYTHTIAYCLRGFYEAGKLLYRMDWADKVWNSLQVLEELQRRYGRLAGSYDTDWKGRYSFICVAGHAQLSLLCTLVARDVKEDFVAFYPSSKHPLPTGDDAHRPLNALSAKLLREVLQAQRVAGGRNVCGALPGSVPFYGPYMPLRYPNWAAKFLLDALLERMEVLARGKGAV